MSLTVLIQIASTATNIASTIAIVVGYYFLIRVCQNTLREMREARMVEGRPQVMVYEDHNSLPTINLVVQNVSPGPTKKVTFEFSAPVEAPDGFVVSDLPYLRRGLEALAPGG